MKKMEKYAEDQKYAKAPTHEDYAAKKKQQSEPVKAYYPTEPKKQPKEVKEQSHYTKEETYKPEEPRYQPPAEQYPPQQESYQPPTEEQYQPRGYGPDPRGRYYQREMTYNRDYRPYEEDAYQGRRGLF